MLRNRVDRLQIRSKSFSYKRVLYPKKITFSLIRESQDWFQSVNYTISKEAHILFDRSVGEYLHVAFPAAFGACIVIPLLVATAFMNSKDSNEGTT